MKKIAMLLCLLLIGILLLTGCSVGLAQHPTETIDRSQQIAIFVVDDTLSFKIPATLISSQPMTTTIPYLAGNTIRNLSEK